MNNKEPSPILVVVLGLQKSLVVVYPIAEEGEDFQEENNVRGSGPEIEERITSGRVKKNRDTREDFEERIEEIDRELNKFGKDEISKLGSDKDLILEEDVSADHVTQLDFDKIMHAEALFPYEDHSGSLLSQKLSRQPRVNEADLVSVPITQNILGDITNSLDKPNNIVTMEVRNRKKKQGQVITDENMIPSSLTKVKRLCKEDCSGLTSKKKVVSLYDQTTLSSMVEVVKQPCEQQ